MQHYEEKRKAKIRTISDSIKENLLEQFKARYDTQQQQSPSKKPGSPLPQRKTSLVQQVTIPIDIPLKEPYGAEAFVKKQARVIMAADRI